MLHYLVEISTLWTVAHRKVLKKSVKLGFTRFMLGSILVDNFLPRG
jgi:hypothetical protein